MGWCFDVLGPHVSTMLTAGLSELTYYIYMARRTPIRLLRAAVRPDFCPQHYPVRRTTAMTHSRSD